MKEKYQLGDLRVLGTTLIIVGVLYGVGSFVIGKVGDVFNASSTGSDNASRIMNYGNDSLITTSQFFEIVGLAVVAGIVIALIVRSL